VLRIAQPALLNSMVSADSAMISVIHVKRIESRVRHAGVISQRVKTYFTMRVVV
jgi:ABC-type arginine transport system permease subunit